ncbi:MAG: nitroreductase family protein [Clostridiales bacterium]|nr:nitroreductase family protein [Clostridiales bacterium]
MSNSVLKAIAERYSCRGYTDQALTEDQLKAIADAAVMAPSAMNLQPWKIIVINDRDILNDLEADAIECLSKLEDKSIYERIMSRGGKVFYNAPTMFLIPIKEGGELDCGIVSQNIALAAHSLGLGSVICGMARLPFDGQRGQEFKERVAFPEGYKFGMSVLVGYPATSGTPHEPDRSKISFIG